MSSALAARGKTVRIKLLQSIAGNHMGESDPDPKTGKTSIVARSVFAYHVGAVLDWDAVEAARFVERGYAVYADEPVKK